MGVAREKALNPSTDYHSTPSNKPCRHGLLLSFMLLVYVLQLNVLCTTTTAFSDADQEKNHRLVLSSKQTAYDMLERVYRFCKKPLSSAMKCGWDSIPLAGRRTNLASVAVIHIYKPTRRIKTMAQFKLWYGLL